MRLNIRPRLVSEAFGTLTKTNVTRMKRQIIAIIKCASIKSYKFGDRAEQQISLISFSVDN